MSQATESALRFSTMFAALGHEARLAIVRLLLQAHPDGLVAGQLQQELGIPASTLSHHLETLTHDGLIVQSREGRFLRYRTDTDSLRALLDFLYEECCGQNGVLAAPGPKVSDQDRSTADSECC